MRKVTGSLRSTSTGRRAEDIRQQHFKDTEPTGQELPSLLERAESPEQESTDEEKRKSLRRTVTVKKQHQTGSLRNTNIRMTAAAAQQLTEAPENREDTEPISTLPLRKPRPTWGARRAVPPATSTLSVEEIQKYLEASRAAREEEQSSDNSNEE